MDEKFKFSLSPDFCMFNGTAIISQEKNKIQFGLVRPEDTDLRMRLFILFATFLRDRNVTEVPVLTFSLLTQRELLNYVANFFVQNKKAYKDEMAFLHKFLFIDSQEKKKHGKSV